MEMSKSNWAVSSKLSSQHDSVFPEFDAAVVGVALISSMAMTRCGVSLLITKISHIIHARHSEENFRNFRENLRSLPGSHRDAYLFILIDPVRKFFTVKSPSQSSRWEASPMAHWVLSCPNCHKAFTHSEVLAAPDKFPYDPLWPPKPVFPNGVLTMQCPHCEKSSSFQRFELMYRPDSR